MIVNPGRAPGEVQALLRGGWVEKAGNEYRLAFKVCFIGAGIHEALRRQAKTCAAAVQILDQIQNTSASASDGEGGNALGG